MFGQNMLLLLYRLLIDKHVIQIRDVIRTDTYDTIHYYDEKKTAVLPF